MSIDCSCFYDGTGSQIWKRFCCLCYCLYPYSLIKDKAVDEAFHRVVIIVDQKTWIYELNRDIIWSV